jgi:hypothetical protein
MNRGVTLFLALVAAGLVAAIFFLRPLLPGAKDRKDSGNFVADFELEDVRAFQITRGEDVLQFKKTPSGWRIAAPSTGLEDRASEPAVYEILSLAQNLPYSDVIRGGEFDRNFRSRDFGLSNPRQQLDIDLGRRKLGLLFGHAGAGEHQTFSRRTDSKDTFLVNDRLQQVLEQPVDSFRDRRLSPLQANIVEKIRLSRGGGEIELERHGSGWRITRPLQADADAGVVTGLLETALGAAVREFLGGEDEWSRVRTADGSESIELRVWPEGEDDPHVLRLLPGDLNEEGEVDAYTVYYGPRRSTLLVAGPPLSLVRSPVDRLRKTELLDLNLDLVDRIGFRSGDYSVNLARMEGGWSDARQELDPDTTAQAVVEFVSALQAVKAVRFHTLSRQNDSEFGLDNPQAEVAFNSWLSENTPEAPAGEYPVRFLAFGRNAEGDWFVRVDNRPEVCQIPPSAFAATGRFVQSLLGNPTPAEDKTPPAEPNDPS